MCVEPGKTWNAAERTRIPLADLSSIAPETLISSVAGDQDRVARDVDARRIFEETTRVPPQNKNFVTLVSDAHGTPVLAASHFAPLSADASVTSLGRWAADSPQASSYAGSDRGAAKAPGGGGLRERIRVRIAERMAAKAAVSSARRGKEEGEPAPRGAEDGAGSIARWAQESPAGARKADALDYYGLWKLFDGLRDAAFYGTHREYALGNTPEQRFMGRWSDGRPVRELLVRR